MACNPILTYTTACNKATVAGVSQLFLIAYNDLAPVSGSTEVYSLAVNEMVDNIGLGTGSTKFVKIGILPKAVAIKNGYTYDQSKGIADYSEELTLPVTNVSTESRKLLKTVASQPVVAIVKFVSGVYVALGLNGQMHVTAAEGAVSGTDNGYSITFTGIADDFSPIVDPTIISGLI